MGWCLASSRPPTSCRLLQVRIASRSCIRPDTTISACCAQNCTGVAAARTSRGENPDSTMLTHLQIRDLAIVDAVELDFMPGLTVLTGRNRRRQVHHRRCADAGQRRTRRGRPDPRRRRARRGRSHLRHPQCPAASCVPCSRNSPSRPKTSCWCAGSSASTAGHAPTSTARPCRCSSCATSWDCCSTCMASTNSSRCCAATRSANCSTPTASSNRWPRRCRRRTPPGSRCSTGSWRSSPRCASATQGSR